MNNKIRYFLILLIPIFIASSVLGVVYYMRNIAVEKYFDKDEVNIDIDSDNTEGIAVSRFDKNVRYKKSEIFPQIRIEDLYSYVEIKNDKPILSEEVVPIMIKIIVTGLGVTFGELHFEWQFITSQHLNFYTYWYEVLGDRSENYNYLLMKNYSIKIYSDNI